MARIFYDPADPRVIYDAQRKIRENEMKARIASRQGDVMKCRFFLDQAKRIRMKILKRFGIYID